MICDEPTTALDVTIQAQILKLINKMKKELNTAVLLITHDIGVISEMADNVIVMFAGKIVEYTNVEDLFKNPLHPYTIGLRRSIPDIDSDDQEELEVIPILTSKLISSTALTTLFLPHKEDDLIE